MKKIILLILSAYIFTSFYNPLQGQSVTGSWWGKLEIFTMEFRLKIDINKKDSEYTASMTSIDQSPYPFPLPSFSFDYPHVEFSHPGARFSYKGFVNCSYDTIYGIFKQNTNENSLMFTRDSIPDSALSSAKLKSKYKKTEVYVKMRDGKKLFTSYYAPTDSSKTYPILFIRTPYNIEPQGPERFNFYTSVLNRYLDEEYILAFQDVRGQYMSEGKFEDIRPFNPDKKDKDIDEASDTYDAVDWLVKNVPNNNGNVGVTGSSYPGFYATMAILSGHPAIKAVSPQAPVTAWFLGDDFHHNGAFFVFDAFRFYSAFGKPRKGLTRQGQRGFNFPDQDTYQFFLREGNVKSLKDTYFGDTIKFWNDAFNHPDYDEFWKSRDPRQYLNKVKPAVMTVGGWFDAEDLYGALHLYKAIEEQNSQKLPNYLVMGPWSHGQWVFGEAENMGNIYWGFDTNKSFHELEVNFFNYYLKGEGKENFKEANIFMTGANKWTSFETWPPKNIEKKKLYFHAAGDLSFNKPDLEKSFDEYISDPNKPVPYSEEISKGRTAEYMNDDQRFASKRPDVMVYVTDVLKEDISLTGPLTAQLFVSTSGTDADYVVKLIDVFPENYQKPKDQDDEVVMGGYQMLVRAEVMRGRYRNSFEKPEAFTPGKIEEVRFNLPDVAHMFKKGHRIMIQVQNSWFPLVDRNPQKFVNIYKCSDDDFQKATHRIYHDGDHASNLEVYILK